MSAALNIKALAVSPEIDLLPLSVLWHKRGIAHRIAEEAGVQVVWLASTEHADIVTADFEAYQRGDLQITLQKKPLDNVSVWQRLQVGYRDYPVTLAMIALSVIGFLLVKFDQHRVIIDWLRIQTIDNSLIARRGLVDPRIAPEDFLAHGQYWRLITPIFLHFGWLHITFNMLWFWEMGRRIEKFAGSVHLLSIIVFIAIASNLYQAAATPFAYFGGMSGVVYGLLGYCAVNYLITRKQAFYLPPFVYVFMLASIVVGWLGIFNFLAVMANTAHLSGLIFGVIIGLASAMVDRFVDGGSRSGRDK